MHSKTATTLALLLVSVSTSLAQSTEQPNLSGYLSAVQSLASALAPPTTSPSIPSTSATSTSSSSVSTSSFPSSITLPSTSSGTPSTLASSSAAASSSTAAGAAASNDSGGIDTRTRNIILGVTIPVGLILLAALVILLVLCCRRRRRRGRRVSSPETAFVGDKSWEQGSNHHHVYGNKTSIHSGNSKVFEHNGHYDAAPLMAAQHDPMPPMSEHPINRTTEEAPPNPFANPIPRKPVPNRDSTGSSMSAANTSHRSSHHSGHHAGLAAGAGALAGAAVLHHHDEKNHQADTFQNRPKSWHRPLSSHPNDQPMYPVAGHLNGAMVQEPRRTSTPFSPDDVGAVHRSNNRFSQGPVEPSVAAHHADHHSVPAIVGPTGSQRRSLEKRNSGYNDDYSAVRRASQSPKRRSLSGGGEMWQADSADTPPIPAQHRYSNGDPYAAPPTPPVLGNQRRYSGGIRSVDATTPPALPSNRHNPLLKRPQFRDSAYGRGTDSSTSNESWESAQAELNPWDYDNASRDPGRYPRFNGGGGNSMAPLIPPAMAWDSGRNRRWSGGNRSSGEVPAYDDRRRSSGASEKRQRLRFSEGEPELYNEHGLVGRAL